MIEIQPHAEPPPRGAVYLNGQWSSPDRTWIQSLQEPVLFFYFSIMLMLCYLITVDARFGLTLLGIWSLPLLVYWLNREIYRIYNDWYIERHVGKTTLLVSTVEPKPGDVVDVVFAKLFRRALTIEHLVFELIMSEEARGPDAYLIEDVIQNLSQFDHAVHADQIYKTNIKFLIPHDARPSAQQTSYGSQISCRIRVMLKCKDLPLLMEAFPLVVTAGANLP